MLCLYTVTGTPPPRLHNGGVKTPLWRHLTMYVAHDLACRVDRLSAPCGVCYVARCLHKGFFYAHVVQGRVPGHLCMYKDADLELLRLPHAITYHYRWKCNDRCGANINI